MPEDFQSIFNNLLSSDSTVSYSRHCIEEDDILAVRQVLESDFLTMGEVCQRFEKALTELSGAKHAIVCTNGTSALHLACMGINLDRHDLGLTSPITFLSSANCIEFCEGRTDFIDIDPASLCLSPVELEKYLEKNATPKVVIPVDLAGYPADLPAIYSLSKKFGFKVIEDAAHSLGSSYEHNGIRYQCGSCHHSDLAIFSFHPVKNITTGEGGAVLTNDDGIADRIRRMRNNGVTKRVDWMRKNDGPWYYEMEELSYNCRLTDFQCALGISQLNKLEKFRKIRNAIFEKYRLAFSAVDGLILPPDLVADSVFHHLYILQFEDGESVRNLVYQKLQEYRIYCQIHYIPVYHQPYYKDKYHYSDSKCPNAELYYSRCLSLPMYPSLDLRVVDLIIDTVIACVKGRR